jgi:hypothetical protein
VLIAEAALEISAPERSEDEAVMFRPQMQELADRCITLFLGAVKPPKNQSLSRAYLAQATLLARSAAGRKGNGLVLSPYALSTPPLHCRGRIRVCLSPNP